MKCTLQNIQIIVYGVDDDGGGGFGGGKFIVCCTRTLPACLLACIHIANILDLVAAATSILSVVWFI